MANILSGDDILTPGTQKQSRNFIEPQLKRKTIEIIHLLDEAINTEDNTKAVIYLEQAKNLLLEITNLVGDMYPRHRQIIEKMHLAEKKVELASIGKTLPEKDDAIINSKNYIPLIVIAGIIGYTVF